MYEMFKDLAIILVTAKFGDYGPQAEGTAGSGRDCGGTAHWPQCAGMGESV